jgi:hypothetical protein
VAIVLYFFSSVFIVIGFMMLFAFRRTRRWELVLLSFVYSGSGFAAGSSRQWWPLIAGFVVAWLLKFAGFDPGKSPKGQSGVRSTPDDSPPGGRA